MSTILTSCNPKVPVTIFSLDTMWTERYEENKFKPFTYPYYNDGRESTIKLLQTNNNENLCIYTLLI